MDFSGFDSLVFAGGGARCLWQAGFCDVLFRESNFKPDHVAGVSAGATIGSIVLAGKSAEGLAYFKKVTALNQKNAYWKNIFTNAQVFPHYEIYRQTIFDLFDQEALARLRSGPSFHVVITKPPGGLGSHFGTLIGLASYMIEKKITYPLHPKLAYKLGFTSLSFPVSDCQSAEDLALLLLQSSCTPPFVPVVKRDGFPALDGGIVNNVPIDAISGNQGRILILLTRPYPTEIIPQNKDRLYLQPSQPIEIKRWDYTNPQGLQIVYDLGKRDAEMILKKAIDS